MDKLIEIVSKVQGVHDISRSRKRGSSSQLSLDWRVCRASRTSSRRLLHDEAGKCVVREGSSIFIATSHRRKAVRISSSFRHLLVLLTAISILQILLQLENDAACYRPPDWDHAGCSVAGALEAGGTQPAKHQFLCLICMHIVTPSRASESF